MSRILAIDWDRREARAVLVNSGATGISVGGAWAVSLATSDPDGLSGQQIGQRLAAAIGDKAGKVSVLVGVGRDNVQMQLLTLPPAPLEELPDLVRFQADREFHSLGSDAALDFVPIAGNEQAQHQVLAIALSPAGLAEAYGLCESLGVELSRAPLRACAAAALVERAGVIASDETALVVNPLTDEADLTVQAGDTVVLMRTVRLPDPTQAAARQRAMLGEIRRTMAAVRQQFTDRKVDRVVICESKSPSSLGEGNKGGGETEERAPSLAADLDVPVTYFDPIAHAPVGLTAQGVAADALSRFAAVLGMALNEADRRPPIIDFLNVRKQVAKKRFTRTHVLAAGAAAVFALWIAGTAWSQLSGPANELAELNEQIAQAQNDAAALKEVTEQAAAIDRWLATDVNWLDELEQFARRVRPEPVTSKQFPVNEDVVITQLIMTRPAGNNPEGGVMNVNAVAKSDAAIRSLERRLSAGQDRVTPGRIQKDNTLPGYPRFTDVQIHVERAEPASDRPPVVSQTATKPQPGETNSESKKEDAETVKSNARSDEKAEVVKDDSTKAEKQDVPEPAFAPSTPAAEPAEPKPEAAP